MNDFSVKKLEPSSEKILLAKITPSYYLNDILVLATGGGGTKEYTCTFPRGEVVGVTAAIGHQVYSLVDLEKVDTITGDNQYTFDSSTKLLTIGLPEKLEVIAGYVSAKYNLYYSSKDLSTGSNPLVPNIDVVSWRGVLLPSGGVSTNVSDTLLGVHSYSTSSIELLNEDKFFYDYISDKDSIGPSDVSIYSAIGSTSNIKCVFRGVAHSFTVTDDLVSISVKDITSKMNQQAKFEDNEGELYIANAPNNSEATPVPFIFGKYSSCGVKLQRVGLNYFAFPDPDTMHLAVCSPYNATIGTSVNRTWVCCRIDGVRDISTTLTDKAGDYYEATNWDSLEVGDTLSNAANNVHILIERKTKVGGDRVSIVTDYYNGDPANGTAFQTNPLPTVVISGGESGQKEIYLAYGKHYTATLANTSGGNKLVTLVLNNNFEGDGLFATFFGGSKILDPTKHKVHYRVRPDTTNHKHGTVLKRLVEASGITVNDPSITTANTQLTSNVAFSIPDKGETEYSSFLEYVTKILQSTYGITRLDNEGLLEYVLLSNPSSTDERSDTEISKQSFTIEVVSDDVYTDLYLRNKVLDSDNDPTSQANIIGGMARTIREKKAKTIYHVLEDVNSRVPIFQAVMTKSRVMMSFTTNNVDLDSAIYEDVLVKREGLPNKSSNRSVKILGLTKGESAVSIDALDLI